MITDFGVGLSGKEPENSKARGSASTCEPYREIIELGLSRDRNAVAIWQDLVSDYGFQGATKAFGASLTSCAEPRYQGSGFADFHI